MFGPNLQSFVLIDIMRIPIFSAEVLMVKFLAPLAYLTGIPLGFLGCSSKAQIILNRLTDVIFVGFAVKLFWIENE